MSNEAAPVMSGLIPKLCRFKCNYGFLFLCFFKLQGEDGRAGAPGEDGNDGSQGRPGPQGPQGPRGLEGTDGIDGEDGGVGPKGPTGPDGDRGPAGNQGIQGPVGNRVRPSLLAKLNSSNSCAFPPSFTQNVEGIKRKLPI